MITLEAHICDQRRSYVVRFATEVQAIEFIERKSTTHAIFELVETNPIDPQYSALLQVLYPSCEHGLSASNCYGPQHYYFDESEQARGHYNS